MDTDLYFDFPDSGIRRAAQIDEIIEMVCYREISLWMNTSAPIVEQY